MARGSLFNPLLICSTLLAVYVAVLFAMFLSMGLGASGKIDPEGWALLAGLLAAAALSGVVLWRIYKRDPRGTRPLVFVAIAVLLVVAAVGLLGSSSDLVTVSSPLAALAYGLFVLDRMDASTGERL